MKSTILSFLLLVPFWQLEADDSAYRTTLNSAHERFRVLEAELHDYRKAKPELTPAQEKDRLLLLGQFKADDPVWVLTEDIQADIDALVAIRRHLAEDSVILDNLKEFSAIASGLLERATTRVEAEQFATTLRQFIIRRDVTGARSWAESR